MATSIPNLWPKEIKVGVATPLTILRVQAELLGKVTRGVLVGVVETEEHASAVQHRLVVVAPAAGNYRHTLLTIEHDADLVYPAMVHAPALRESEENTPYLAATSDDVLLYILGKALGAPSVVATINSLLAKSNLALPPASAVADDDNE